MKVAARLAIVLEQRFITDPGMIAHIREALEHRPSIPGADNLKMDI